MIDPTFDRSDRPGGESHPEDISEKRQSLWLLAGSPTVWAAHFMACYLTAAIWCAKAGSISASLGGVRTAIVVYTIVALAAIGWITRIGWRRHDYGTAAVPHDFDTRADRHRFLGFATVLLSGLSAVAVIYVALVGAFFRTCW